MAKILRPIRRVSVNLKPEREIAEAPGILQGIKAIICASWLNILLIFVPLSWAFNWATLDDDVLVFIFSLLAIIPLAKLLSLVTEEMAMRVGQALAILFSITLGNVVVLIVGIIAIIKCELQVVQSSLIGSILSNLLLVLGICLFSAGLRSDEHDFGASASRINSSFLTLSAIAVSLPGAFHFVVQPDSSGTSYHLTNEQEGSDIKKLSLGVAVILLFSYGSFISFQLWSHARLYDENGNLKSNGNTDNTTDDDARNTTTDGTAGDVEAQEVEEPEVPMMSLTLCTGLLIVVTVLIAVTADCLVDSIDGVTDGTGLSKEWIGLILQNLAPVIGNFTAQVTAFSSKTKVRLSINVAIGSSIQIALFVIPLMVIIAWALGKPLLMLFDPFESVTLFFVVLMVTCVVQDGEAYWIKGLILMCVYVVIAVCFFFYPGSDIADVLAQCT